MLGAPPTVVPTWLQAGQTSTLRRDIARAQLSMATRGEDPLRQKCRSERVFGDSLRDGKPHCPGHGSWCVT